MPYEIVERDNQYCVAKADTGEILDGACHDTREDAVNQLQAIEANENKSIMFGGKIKSLGGNRMGGYLIEYTDEDNRDLDGEFFTDKTDQKEDDYPTIGLPVLFQHGMDKKLGVKKIGKIVESKIDEVGLWVEAILDEHNEYKEYVASISVLVAKGILSWSSGAFPQSVEVDDNGFIKSWAKIEGSLTHTPANPSGTKIQTLKSIASLIEPREAETSIEDSDKTLADLSATVQKLNDNVASTKESEMSTQKNPELIRMIQDAINQLTSVIEDYMNRDDKAEIDEELVEEVVEKIDHDMEDEDLEMTDKSLRKYVDSVIEPIVKKNLAKLRAEKDAGIESTKAMADRLREDQERAAKGVSQAGSYGNGNGSKNETHIQVKSHLDHWKAEDFSFAYDLGRQVHNSAQSLPLRIDQAFMREYADKSLIQYEKRTLDLTPSDIKSFNAIKADEVMDSTQVGFGDEHVPTAWRDQIWLRVRRDNVIAPLIDVVEMPTNPYILPVESNDPTVFNVPETTDQSQLSLTSSPIPDSKIATVNVTLTAGKLGLLTFISAELAEDAVSGAIPRYRAQAERAIADSIDFVIANGDDATSGNINADGVTPSTTALFTIWDGLLVNAIVTNSTNAADNSGNAVTLNNIRTTRFLLDRSKQKPSDLAIITHPEVEAKLLNMDEFLTMDKAGPHATNMSGQIGVIDGIPVFISNEILTSDADGKVTDAGNVVERGRLIIVNRASWYLGYRRRIAIDFTFTPGWDAWALTATVRLAFIGQDADSVSVLFNIGI